MPWVCLTLCLLHQRSLPKPVLLTAFVSQVSLDLRHALLLITSARSCLTLQRPSCAFQAPCPSRSPMSADPPPEKFGATAPGYPLPPTLGSSDAPLAFSQPPPHVVLLC